MKINFTPFGLIEKSTTELNSNVPVALISLTDQGNRRAILAGRGIPLDWVNNYWLGHDYRGMDRSEFYALADVTGLEARHGRPLRAGEIGCAQSHKAASPQMLQFSCDLLLVLEDDVIPESSHVLEQVALLAERLLPHARSGAAFVCLLGAPEQQADGALKRRVVSPRRKPDLCPDLFLHIDPVKTLWRAHAYFISKEAAQRALTLEPKILTLADDWCERRRLGVIDEILYCRPIVFRQDEVADSTIRPRDHGENHKPKKFDGTLTTRLLRSVSNGTFMRQARASILFRIRNIAFRFQSLFPYYLR